eukprot:gene768-833_t
MSHFIIDTSYATWARQDLKIITDPRLEIQQFLEGDDERGIYAKSTIPSNATLAVAPFTSLLTITHATNIPELAPLQGHCREDDLLSLLLLYEKHVMDDDLVFIQGTNLYNLAIRWKQQVKDDFQELVIILEKHGLRQPTGSDKETTISPSKIYDSMSFEDYLWCLSTIWSRFITVDRQGHLYRAMVPVVDLLNHHPAATVCHQFRSHEDRFYLIAPKGCEEGQEVYLNYGPLPNSKLMMLYGFALLTNTHHTVDLWASMDPKCSHYSLKMSLLKKAGIVVDQPFTLTGQGLPLNLLLFLRLQHLEGKELLASSSKKLLERLQHPISVENEKRVLEVLDNVVRNMLAGYPRSLAEDKQKLEEWGLLSASGDNCSADFCHPMHHEKHSLMLVFSDKVILHSVLDEIEGQLQNMS